MNTNKLVVGCYATGEVFGINEINAKTVKALKNAIALHYKHNQFANVKIVSSPSAKVKNYIESIVDRLTVKEYNVTAKVLHMEFGKIEIVETVLARNEEEAMDKFTDKFMTINIYDVSEVSDNDYDASMIL